MRYEDAIKIGSAVEGYVRCTYVRLNDVKNGYLYSLQHHDAYKVSDAHIEASEYFDGQANYGGGAASDQVQQDIINTADYSAFVKDVPVVKAIGWDYSWGKQKHVECKLTDYARDVIYEQVKRDYHRQKKYLVEKVWVKDLVMQDGFVAHKAGERQVMIDTYKRDKAYTEEFTKDTTAKGYKYVITDYWTNDTEIKNANLAEVLNRDATFIVKECAIDWFPTKIDGMFITDKDGKLITLDMALDAAKKRLDRAKAILAATTTFAIF